MISVFLSRRRNHVSTCDSGTLTAPGTWPCWNSSSGRTSSTVTSPCSSARATPAGKSARGCRDRGNSCGQSCPLPRRCSAVRRMPATAVSTESSLRRYSTNLFSRRAPPTRHAEDAEDAGTCLRPNARSAPPSRSGGVAYRSNAASAVSFAPSSGRTARKGERLMRVSFAHRYARLTGIP